MSRIKTIRVAIFSALVCFCNYGADLQCIVDYISGYCRGEDPVISVDEIQQTLAALQVNGVVEQKEGKYMISG